MPTLDCLLTVHNNEKTLTACLDSILGQSEPNFRLLIYDDGSQDASCDILKKAKQKDPRIEVITSQTHRGEAYAFNQLFKSAKSPLIALHRASDTSEKNRFEQQIQRLKNSSLIALGSAVLLSEKVTQESPKEIPFPSNPKDVLMLQIFSKSRLGLALGSCMYKKEALKTKDPLITSMPENFDVIFHMQLQQRYPLRLASLEKALITTHALPHPSPLEDCPPTEHLFKDLMIQLLQTKELYYDNILVTPGYIPY